MLAPVVDLWGVIVLGNVLVLSRERPRRMVYCVGVAAVVNIVLNFTLIPAYDDGRRRAGDARVGGRLRASMAMWLALLEVGRINWLSMRPRPSLAAAGDGRLLVLLGGLLAGGAGRRRRSSTRPCTRRSSGSSSPDDLRSSIDLLKRRLPRRARARGGAAS